MNTIFTVHTVDAPLSSLDRIVEYAIGCNAHLNVHVVSVVAAVPLSAYPGIPNYGTDMIYDFASKQAIERIEDVKSHLNNSDVSFSTAAVCQPILTVSSSIGAGAMFADLAIIPPRHEFSDALYSRCLEGVLYDARIPAVILPNNMQNPLSFKSVVAGWHPSANAATAIRNVIPLLQEESQIHITVVDPTEIVYGSNPGDNIATVLARKNLNATVDCITSNGRGAAQALSQKAMDVNADMLVMGAYGHSRMREWFLGGTTKEILDNPPCPVLMCH